MIHAADDNDTRGTAIHVLDKYKAFSAWIAKILKATRTSLHKVEVAHALRCDLASFSAEEFQDTGIDPSDATGIASWQPDLPFFMQGGCGRE
jgi:hypothetical protein